MAAPFFREVFFETHHASHDRFAARTQNANYSCGILSTCTRASISWRQLEALYDVYQSLLVQGIQPKDIILSGDFVELNFGFLCTLFYV